MSGAPQRFVVQGRREGDDDDVVIVEADTLELSIDWFVDNVLDCKGRTRDDDYFIIAADTLENFLTNTKLEIQ